MEGEVVVEAFFGQVGEGVGGLRRPLGVERDLEAAAAGLDHRGHFFALLQRLLRRLQGDLLRRRRFDLLAAVGARWRWCVESSSPPPREIRIAATTPIAISGEDGEDDPAAVRLLLHRRESLDHLRSSGCRTPPLTPLAAAVLRSAAAGAGARGRVRRGRRRPLPRPRVPGGPGPRGRQLRGGGSAATARIGLDPEGRVAFKAGRPRSLPFPDDLFDLVAQLDGRPRGRRDRPGAAARRLPDPRLLRRRGTPPAGSLPARRLRLGAGSSSGPVEAARRRRQLLCRPTAAATGRRRPPTRLRAAWRSRGCR